MAAKNLLAGYNPVGKFLAVKSIVFATFWQSMMVSMVPGLPEGDTSRWDDFIVCLEMPLFALMHNKVPSPPARPQH